MRRATADPGPRVEARTPEGVVHLWVARRPFQRLIGLAGRRDLGGPRGLLIPACGSVHTVGMRFELDVAFGALDGIAGDLCVLAVRRAVPPWRFVRHRGRRLPARTRIAALELAAGQAERLGVRAGAVLAIRACAPRPPVAE
jgi:uncharacterized membrane protein (UPF0127 family)